MLQSLDIDAIKATNRDKVKEHFFRLWVMLPQKPNFWSCIRDYCASHNEPDTYLAVMLVSQALLHHWRIKPETHEPGQAWSAIEEKLEVLKSTDEPPAVSNARASLRFI
jgi:hypothetical protein